MPIESKEDAIQYLETRTFLLEQLSDLAKKADIRIEQWLWLSIRELLSTHKSSIRFYFGMKNIIIGELNKPKESQNVNQAKG